MMLKNKLPTFEQLVFEFYVFYHHTNNPYRTTGVFYLEVKERYNVVKSDTFKHHPLYRHENGGVSTTSALHHAFHIIENLLKNTQVLRLDFDENYTSENFKINYFRGNKNYILFLVSHLCSYIFYDDFAIQRQGFERVVKNIEKEFKNLNKALYGNEQDEFLNGLKDDLIDLMQSRLGKKNCDENERTLDKSIDTNFDLNSKDIKVQLLSQLKSLNPTQFEHFALFLIASITKEKNDSISDLITHNGQVGDGGVDGIVNIKTPLNNYDKYFIQCKRYDKTTISRPELQAFVGSMVGYNANKGIFITTSNFTSQALEYVNNLNNYSIITMNGNDLVSYMLEHKIGIVEESYLSLDKNFFDNFKG